MKNLIFICFGAFAISGCLTRAPTTYELDRRAGFTPPGEVNLSDDLSKMRTSSNVARAPLMPVRIAPLIEKVWISDITLADGVKMQGTWLFVEVEPGRWFDEIDSGAAPLIPTFRTTKTPVAKKKVE